MSTAAIALGTTRHGRHTKASNGLVRRLVGHLQHEILGFALEREVADLVAAAGDGHDDDEGVILLVKVLKAKESDIIHAYRKLVWNLLLKDNIL